MLSWNETDKLNEIANDQTKSADDRKSEIGAFMRIWGELVNTRATLPCNYALVSCDDSDEIDPYTQSKVEIPLTGQTGFSYSPGY